MVSPFHSHEWDLPDQIIVCPPIPHANYVNTKENNQGRVDKGLK